MTLQLHIDETSANHCRRCSRIATFLLFTILLLSPLTDALAETMVPLHVEKGTSLIHIARRYCVNTNSWRAIAYINHLKPPYTIYANSTIHIPLSLLITKNVAATVASVSGLPLLVTADNKTATLHTGDLVLPGQTVVTGEDEHVHLLYPNYKHSRIGPNSEMTLTYLMRLTDENLQAKFSLKRGKVIHSIHKKLKKNEHFNTVTPVAITGVRGTEFRLKIMADETNIVETLQGRVTLAASGKERIIAQGEGSMVKKNLPPSAPRKLPARPEMIQLETMYRTLPLVLHVPNQQKIEFVRLRITTETEEQKTILEQVSNPGGTFIIPSIPDGKYQLFLTAVDSDKFESMPSAPATLSIRTSPAAPVISKPNSGLRTFENSVNIYWLQSEQAAYYTFQLATNPDFSDILDEQQTTDTSYSREKLEPGTYFFRVRLTAPDDFSTLYSVPLTWTVLEQPKLGNLPQVEPGAENIQLTWPAVKDMAGYGLQIATDKQFTHLIINQEQLTEPSYTIEEHLSPGKYYVRMHSIVNDGQKSPWTPAQIMTIDPEPFGIEHIFLSLGFLALILL